MQAGELVASSLGKNFHAAIVIIAYPASNAQYVRLALDEPAESDALYASADQKAASF